MKPFISIAINTRRGFSLVEMTLALGLSGILLGGIWQVVGMSTRSHQQQVLASQALSVASAGQSYIRNYNTTLLALPTLNTIGSVAKIRVTDADTGEAGVLSLQGAAFLPSNFINLNSFNQTYAFYVRREDAGSAGVDANDRLVGLLITTDGQDIPDIMGSSIAGSMGAAGGFIYADSNPASPAAATDASGAAGGWAVALDTDWAAIGAEAVAGHIAVLTNLLPYSAVTSSSGSGSIDDLSDAKADYVDSNMLLGTEATTLTTGYNNTGLGVNSSINLTSGYGNTGFGRRSNLNVSDGYNNTGLGMDALTYNTHGLNNTGVGQSALVNATADGNSALGSDALKEVTSGVNNIGIGYNAGSAIQTSNNNIVIGVSSLDQTYYAIPHAGDDNTVIGFGANQVVDAGQTRVTVLGSGAMRGTHGNDITALGYWAMLNTSDFALSTGSTAVGSSAWMGGGLENAVVGAYTGSANGGLAGHYNAVLGYAAMSWAGTGGPANYNVAVGHGAFAQARTGANNVAVGAAALDQNTAGIESTAVGYQSMQNNTVAGVSYNTAVGAYTLKGDATIINNFGTYNTAVGHSALTSNASGTANVGLGYASLLYNYNGNYNVAIGTGTQTTNVSGAELTAVGYLAMHYADATIAGAATVKYNTALGAYALRGGDSTTPTNNTGTRNTALGHSALRTFNSGSNNVAAGYQALENLSTGDNNVAVGNTALWANTQGSDNVAIGKFALSTNLRKSQNTAIGYYAMVNANSAALGGNTNNTALGAYALSGSSVSSDNTGRRNTAVGHSALLNVTSGDNNVAVGVDAGLALTTGGNNTLVGYATNLTNGTRTNSTALGNGASITASNQIVLGNTSIAEIRAQVTSITAISDARHKHEVADLPLGLDFITALHPVQYRLNENGSMLRYGFLAQDVEKVLPPTEAALFAKAGPQDGLALISRDEDKDGTYHMAYGELIAPLVKSVQELDAENKRLREELSAIQARLSALEAK